MLDYLLNRWTITRKFERAGVGYVYRKRPDLPGYVVTEQQRKDLLREFNRRYWRFWLGFVACVLAGIIVISVATVVFELSETLAGLVTYAFFGALLVSIAWAKRASSLLPEEYFAKCPRTEPERPGASWPVRFHQMMRDRSWISHITLALVNGALAWHFSFNLAEAKLGQWLLLLAFIAALIVTLYGALHKARSTDHP